MYAIFSDKEGITKKLEKIHAIYYIIMCSKENETFFQKKDGKVLEY